MARTKEELEQTITQQWLSDAWVNAEYNRLTGNKSWASNFYNTLPKQEPLQQNTNVSMPKTWDISNVWSNQWQILPEQQPATPNVNIEQIQPTPVIKHPEVVIPQNVETISPEISPEVLH